MWICSTWVHAHKWPHHSCIYVAPTRYHITDFWPIDSRWQAGGCPHQLNLAKGYNCCLLWRQQLHVWLLCSHPEDLCIIYMVSTAGALTAGSTNLLWQLSEVSCICGRAATAVTMVRRTKSTCVMSASPAVCLWQCTLLWQSLDIIIAEGQVKFVTPSIWLVVAVHRNQTCCCWVRVNTAQE